MAEKIYVRKGVDKVCGEVVCHVDGNLIRKGRFYDGEVLFNIDGRYVLLTATWFITLTAIMFAEVLTALASLFTE